MSRSTADLEDRLRIASLAVQAAARLTKSLQRSLGDVTAISKQDTSPVTIGDFAVQALLTSILHAAFPSDDFIAEESADALRQDVKLRKEVFTLITAKSTLEVFAFDVDAFDDAIGSQRKAVKHVLPKTEDEMMHIIDMGGKNTRSEAGRTWIMDPIDGTATFMRGQQFVINCALLQDGKEALGIIGCPNLAADATQAGNEIVDREGMGCIVYAVKGQGTHVRRIHGDPTTLAEGDRVSRLSKESSSQAKDALKWTDDDTATSTIIPAHRSVAAKLNMSWPGSPLHSSVMKYAILALGLADVCIRIFKHHSYISNAWDHAGGVLIYTEAGGKVTDSAGQEIDFSRGRKMSGNFGLVCAPEGSHGKVLERVQNAMNEYEKA